MKKTILLLVVAGVGIWFGWEWNVRRGLKEDMFAAFARYDLLVTERFRPVPRFAAAYDAAQPRNSTELAIAAMSSFNEPAADHPSGLVMDAFANWQTAESVELRIRAGGILESELNQLLAQARNDMVFRTNAALLELQNYLTASRPMISNAFEVYLEARNAYLERTEPGVRKF